MFTLASLKCAALVALAAPSVPKHHPQMWVAPSPKPPAQLRGEIITRQLSGYRHLLATSESVRKIFEWRPDRENYSTLIESMLRQEAEYKRQIAGLERWASEPVPRMQFVLPGPARPKPPVRD